MEHKEIFEKISKVVVENLANVVLVIEDDVKKDGRIVILGKVSTKIIKGNVVVVCKLI